MHMRRVPIIFFALLVVSSCDNVEFSGTKPPPAPTTDDLVIADCYVLRDALEAFAAENDGVYPSRADEQSVAGNQFTTFLPGGGFANRYSGLPVDSRTLFQQPQWPGEIGVITFWTQTAEYDFDPPRGYRITGRGRYGELITIANLDEVPSQAVAKYDSVLANLETVVQAVELFAQIGGQYPSDVGADDLPSGDVLTDLLPGGRLIVNPFSYVQDSPSDGDPTGVSGMVGYTPQDPDGDGSWDGYQIDVVGAHPNIIIATRTRDTAEDGYVRYIASSLRDAVEQFASQNGDVFPRNVGIDETPSGDTVLEILSCTCMNPYTNTPAVRGGLAVSRGQVGYLPLEYNGDVVGYVINAMGIFDVEIERFEVLTN
jgi:hypothetical protein